MVETLERIECLHQIGQRMTKIKIKGFWSKNGEGDCSTCIYDPEKNKKCIDYIPIKSYNFYVEENGKQRKD